MIPRDLRGTVAIVGADEADEIGLVPGKSVLTLQAEAVRNAVTDAGLKISDIDGIFTAGGGFAPSSVLGEYLGISPRYTDGTSVGGCSFILMVEHAMLALHAGIIDVAVVAHAESGRSRIGAGGGRVQCRWDRRPIRVAFWGSRGADYLLAPCDPAHA